MVVTVVSPDKISISMFLSYMKFRLGKEYMIGMIQSIWSKESIDLYVEDFLKKTDKLLFSYYVKSKVTATSNEDLLKIIPEKLVLGSNLIVWMGQFSTTWVVLKDKNNQAPEYIDRWNQNISKMGG